MKKGEILPKSRMLLNEIMTIFIMFQLSNYRIFNWYYIKEVMKHPKADFPDLISYNRFVEIMKFALVSLLLYTIKAHSGKCSGISFIDSTPIKVFDSHKMFCHKIFS